MSAPVTHGVHVRELLNFTPVQVMLGLKRNFNLIFEDGKSLMLSSKEMVVNRFMWELIRVVVPTLPLISTYSVNNYFTNGIYTSKSLNSMFEDMFRDIVTHVDNREILPAMYEKMYRIFNDIYNDLVNENTQYALSLNILDFLEIQFDKRLIDSIVNVANEKTNDSIQASYAVLDDIIYNKPSLRNNPVAIGYMAKTINPNQVKQLLGPRGYITEINSKIFQYPVASSLTLGLRNLYDLTVESRSSAKALFMSTKAIQNTEYTSREMQLGCMSVERLVDGDCGNNDYLPWRVRGVMEMGKSDIDNLLGTKFYNEETGKEEFITPKHKHLEGKTILLRTANKCRHPDKNSICTGCFGQLSYNVHKNYGLGHLASATQGQYVSQAVLSTKHHTMSAVTAAIVLGVVASQWFNVKTKNNYAFKPNIIKNVKGKVNMIINQNDGFGIKDLHKGVDVYKLNPQWVTKIESFILQVIPDNGKEEFFPIIVKDGNKYGSFSYEFLDYITKTGYTLDDADRYVINLDGWTSTTNILSLPQIEFNFLALNNAIKSKFKYMSSKNGTNTPESMITSIFDLVNSKLNINIKLIEVMVYAFTVDSVKNDNFDMGRNSVNPEMTGIYNIIGRRSLGGIYAHEKVLPIIISPKVFDGRNGFDHPLDVYIKPNEVVRAKFGTIVN